MAARRALFKTPEKGAGQSPVGLSPAAASPGSGGELRCRLCRASSSDPDELDPTQPMWWGRYTKGKTLKEGQECRYCKVLHQRKYPMLSVSALQEKMKSTQFYKKFFNDRADGIEQMRRGRTPFHRVDH